MTNLLNLTHTTLESLRGGWSTSLKRGVNEKVRQRTCALFLITDFIWFVAVDDSFLALNHFRAQKYEAGGGTFTVLP